MIVRKKGQATLVPEEIIKIILSIGVILGLIYLLYLLFTIFTANQQLEQAKANILSLEEKFKSMEEGTIEKFTLESPKGWVFVSLIDKNKYCICKNENTCDDKEKSFCVDRANVIVTNPKCVKASYFTHHCIPLEKVPVHLEINKVYDTYSINVKVESVSQGNTQKLPSNIPNTGSGGYIPPAPAS